MSDDNLLGQQLDEYRLETLLGQGGMARVYRGLDVRLNRWVAIKVIDAPFRTDSDYTRRFEREARAIAQLEHPHIVRLYRYGEASGLLYMAMQYIEGAAVDSVLARYREEDELMPVPDVRRIIREVCLALDYAHSKGVIHRDVKPSNIMLDRQGNAVLTDFGLALLTEVGTQGEIFGTPHYIAPEQAISSAGAVPQSDLYAIGVILYEIFTGELPFDAPSALDVALLHMSEPPPPPRQIQPDIAPELEEVILKALAKEPEERYPTGAALADALDQALVAKRRPSTLLPTSNLSLSVLDRVAVELAEHPLPLIPAAVSAPGPEPVKAEAAISKPEPLPGSDQPATDPFITSSQIKAPAAPKVAEAAPATKRPLIYAAMSIGAILVVGLILILLVSTVFFMTRGGDEEGQAVANQDLTPPATPLAVADEAAAASNDPSLDPAIVEAPAASPTPVPPPTLDPATTEVSVATPTPVPPPAPILNPEPGLLADTNSDFASSPGNWDYLWLPPGGNWLEMSYEDRQTGSCWYTDAEEDYVRICQSSGHPGDGADIAWRWTSAVSGPLQVRVFAKKEDRGGDGVEIGVYHVTPANIISVFEGKLPGKEKKGVIKKFEIETMAPGDALYFVMSKGRDATHDHTAFQAQVCYAECPADDNWEESEEDKDKDKDKDKDEDEEDD